MSGYAEAFCATLFAGCAESPPSQDLQADGDAAVCPEGFIALQEIADCGAGVTGSASVGWGCSSGTISIDSSMLGDSFICYDCFGNLPDPPLPDPGVILATSGGLASGSRVISIPSGAGLDFFVVQDVSSNVSGEFVIYGADCPDPICFGDGPPSEDLVIPFVSDPEKRSALVVDTDITVQSAGSTLESHRVSGVVGVSVAGLPVSLGSLSELNFMPTSFGFASAVTGAEVSRIGISAPAGSVVSITATQRSFSGAAFTDPNQDGLLNFDDVIYVRAHVGFSLGDSGYSVACDQNIDGTIDRDDIGLMGTQGCYADVNLDGIVDGIDTFDFLALLDAESTSADLDADFGTFDIFDLFAFFVLFDGCGL